MNPEPESEAVREKISEHDGLLGSFVRYFHGTEQILRLNDEYWTTVEECFKDTHSDLKEAMTRLKQSTEAGRWFSFLEQTDRFAKSGVP